jgi:hypothetical protein
METTLLGEWFVGVNQNWMKEGDPTPKYFLHRDWDDKDYVFASKVECPFGGSMESHVRQALGNIVGRLVRFKTKNPCVVRVDKNGNEYA